MAIAVTAVVNRPTYKSWTVTALDADTTLAFNHNMGAAPDEVVLTPQNAALATTVVSNWSVAVSSTQITLNKNNVAGSGGAVPGTTIVLKLTAKLPHSIL